MTFGKIGGVEEKLLVHANNYNSVPLGVSGNLRTMLPGDLLQWLSLGQKTGTLVVSNKAVEKKIFFKNGRVISSASNDPREYLGQFLMSHGYMSEPELMKGMQVQAESGILLGKILVMIDVISEEELQRLMRMKAEEAIYDIFLWRDGEFRFEDNDLPTQEMIPLQVDVTGIIMEGTRRVDEWQRIRLLIPNEALLPAVIKALDEDVADSLHFDDAQRTVVAAIDGKRNVADIVLESRSSSFLVAETLYHLVREGYIELREPAPEKAAAMAAAASAKVSSAKIPAVTETPEDEVTALLTRAQQALRGRDYEKAQRLLKAAENLDPNHPKVRNAIKGAEAAIVSDLRTQGLLDSKVPTVAKSFDEIAKMNFTPNEGFMLSRVNGQWDIGSLIKISPIREPDALLIFYRLWKDGIIALAEG
ncbi:MAG TPA: DUF4388 domain-containing protein [Thermoanaerobaculia bacterium]|nr:DUF4388 domain-containing protein [Thermoanaerobaculia bacterium]